MLIAQPQRLDRPTGVDGGLEHRRIERPDLVTPRPHQVVPSGNATTVWPAYSRAATVATTSGSCRRLARSIGMTLTMRAIIRTATVPATSARATNDSGDARHRPDGSTAPIVRMSSQDMWSLTTSTPGRLRIGPPDTVISTPRHHSSIRQ